MHRFYVEEADARGLYPLTAEDAHHARKVLRLQPGSEVELITGGKRYRATLTPEGLLEAGEALPSTEPRLRITLLQGLPKGDKMDLIVQKTVELGVSRIIPVQMSRCVVHLAGPDGEKKRARWQKIAREAGKQSGRCLVPEVSLPVPLSALPSLTAEEDACLVPWEEARSTGPLAFVQAHPHLEKVSILIGPEGGIAPEEMTALSPAFQPMTLGPRILRTETAGLACVSALLALYGEME